MYDTNVIQLGNTNNKMATPAPVQLQLPLTVSGLVCCVFVYGAGFHLLCAGGVQRLHPCTVHADRKKKLCVFPWKLRLFFCSPSVER